MSTGNIRERFLTIMSTRLYTQLEPQETLDLHDELERYLRAGDPSISEAQNLSLIEMLFYLSVYLGYDVNAQVLYGTLRDRLGERSPRLYVMNATLKQINESDPEAIAYLEKLLAEEYEFDSDPATYGLIAKKLLAIKWELARAAGQSTDELMRELVALIEKLPLDPELWWYLGDLYVQQGRLPEAKYCFEEVVLIMPFNYVAFARLAEVQYYAALREKDAKKDAMLQEALNYALRAVELSGLYLKGWSFVAVTAQLLQGKDKVLALAVAKLKEISKVSNSNDRKAALHILESKKLA